MPKKILGGVGVAGIAMFGFWSTIAVPVCSCVPAADSLRHQIGAHPVKDEPERVRQAFLAKLPAGTPEEELMAFLRGSNHSLNRCERSGDTMQCRFNYAENFWGKTGYALEVRFDAANRLQDVRFAPF